MLGGKSSDSNISRREQQVSLSGFGELGAGAAGDEQVRGGAPHGVCQRAAQQVYQVRQVPLLRVVVARRARPDALLAMVRVRVRVWVRVMVRVAVGVKVRVWVRIIVSCRVEGQPNP